MLNFSLNSKDGLAILCLGAHCDDIEIGCGGSLLKIMESFNVSEVWWVVMSSNDVRREEALHSATTFLQDVPNKNILIKEFKDGFLPYHGAEVKDFFESLKSQFEPNLIFTHYRDDRHQDHRLVNDLTWNTFRNHLILEYEIPKYDGDLGIPNFFVELEENYIRKKNEILLNSFTSQSGKHWFDEETFNALPRLRGMESLVKYAEAFYARKIMLNPSTIPGNSLFDTGAYNEYNQG